MPFWSNFWVNQKHYLNRMTLRQLTIAYFQYPAILTYIFLLGISIYMALPFDNQVGKYFWSSQIIAVIVAILVYPMIWYLLHRYILHGRFLYRSPKIAAVWKRIHFDHHHDLNNLAVLFWALYTPYRP